ncbi:TraR/DksA family transcriptional regulator [Patescibacteria group bacterium]|nr:TraR/DksA family transcriptional regulator [Patescibacteria group bacterium]
MDQAFIEDMQKALLAEKKKLEAELSRFAHRNSKAVVAEYDAKFPEFGDDKDENATEIAAYSNDLSLEDALERALRDADNGLKRIEEGTYGVCKYCQTQINKERLQVRPTSTSCIACKKTLTQEV